MVTPLDSQPCWLLDLPHELKLHIINHLDRLRDLYNLSLTCRIFEDVTMRRLYHKVDVEIPLRSARKAGSPALRAPVIESMRDLTLRNGTVDRKRSNSYTRRRKSDAGNTNSFVQEILDRVSANQLTNFAYLHPIPMTVQTFEILTRKHKSTLQHLSFYELDSALQTDVYPTGLRTLHSHTVNDGEFIVKILSQNKATIESLKLGQERYMIDGYHGNRLGFLDHLPQPNESFYASAYSLVNFPRLRQLSLHGLSLDTLRPSSIPQALFLCKLERFTLESCSGSAELLESLAETFHWASSAADAPRSPSVTPSLKQFSFRHERPTIALKDSMVRFLASFAGLETLSLLFENATFLERPSTLIADHGPTIRTLVLESRIQPREHLSHDTSRPFGVGGYSQDIWEESINDIARLCPNIVELGIGFPWDNEMIRLRKTLLPTLQHLRTIHIRNFPENQVFSQLGDYTIKEYATKFVEWVFPALVGANRPALEHFAMGPTLYESRWKMAPAASASGTGAPPQHRQLPEFLHTHHFALDWAKTRFGRWSPLITPVSEKCMEEMCDRKPLGGVFEQVWLK